MKQTAVLYVSTLLALIAIDFVWLSVMGARLYRPVLKDMLLQDFRPAPAILFYLLFAAGVVWFAGLPALTERSWRAALVNGALLGLVCYATYDLTNQATLRDWASVLTLADMAWGTVLSALAATIGYAVARAFGD
ncbi:MAG: DUF2177 family protein [Hyphomicrobiales bacterium]|nr:DUF2177 family protein [Hyphomicrobiales bacterium]